VLVVFVVALVVGYGVGRSSAKRSAAPDVTFPPSTAEEAPSSRRPAEDEIAAVPPAPTPARDIDHAVPERARIIRSLEAEAHKLRRALASRLGEIAHLASLAAERTRLFGDLASAREETARYRQLIVDLENDAAPPIFGTGAPDDLKLIVGIGPVLERMLHQLGVGTYRQIARWSERDIDEFDAKLKEFPGRIRRDAWVTQARALHQSKYGESLPARDEW
jgi:predicted flap endonuclease-1-like 5' DNA nuclease